MKDDRTKKITVYYQGKHYNATELAREHGVVPSTFRRRLSKGLSVEDALEKRENKKCLIKT